MYAPSVTVCSANDRCEDGKHVSLRASRPDASQCSCTHTLRSSSGSNVAEYSKSTTTSAVRDPKRVAA